jgi:hypothetical protein
MGGRRVVTPPLPYAKEVQYLVFGGTQCVETAAPANTMKLRVVYNGRALSGGEANVLGLWSNTTSPTQRVYVGPYNTNARCMLVASEYNVAQTANNVYAEQTVDIPGALHTLIKAGVTYTKRIGNFGTFDNPNPIGIGGRNAYHSTNGHYCNEYMFVGNVYEYERWDGGVQTAKYIPVVDLNGVACFYDEIGGALHYPWTGNPLVAGPDK